MKNLITALSGLAIAFAAGNALAADIEAGKKKAAEVCAACHGPDGNATTTAAYPKLAGQYADYLSKALHDYKSGERKDPIMAGMAAPLDNKDIDNLAAYFASQPGLKTK